LGAANVYQKSEAASMIRVATLTVQTTKAGSKQPAFLSDRDANYRPLETRPIFRRVDETKDHVPIIVRIGY